MNEQDALDYSGFTLAGVGFFGAGFSALRMTYYGLNAGFSAIEGLYHGRSLENILVDSKNMAEQAVGLSSEQILLGFIVSTITLSAGIAVLLYSDSHIPEYPSQKL